MRSREHLEAQEDRELAPYAMRSSASRGRTHAEPEHGYRAVYQRDRDRVVHCAAFRRLEYKTQVFVNSVGDYYRTRLTHTLEVAQIARTIARALGLNGDLTEALALAHDLGHGPFGHAGERALARSMEGHGGFEHNRQSLRIVDRLEARYPGFPGLNLSFETREGMAKHGDYRTKGLAPEFDIDAAPSLEAVVADTADRLAYNHHDLDDGLTSGVLEEAALREVPHVDAAFREVDEAHPGLPAALRVNQVFIRLLNAAVTDLVQASSARLGALATASPEAARAAVRAALEPFVAFSAEGMARNEALHAFLYEAFYCHWQVARMQENAKRYVTTVFDYFVEHPRTLPPPVATRLESDGVYQTVCDHVASMTDRELSDEYRQILLP